MKTPQKFLTLLCAAAVSFSIEGSYVQALRSAGPTPAGLASVCATVTKAVTDNTYLSDQFQQKFGLSISVCASNAGPAAVNIQRFVNNPANFDPATNQFVDSAAAQDFVNEFVGYSSLFGTPVFRTDYLSIAQNQLETTLATTSATAADARNKLGAVATNLSAVAPTPAAVINRADPTFTTRVRGLSKAVADDIKDSIDYLNTLRLSWNPATNEYNADPLAANDPALYHPGPLANLIDITFATRLKSLMEDKARLDLISPLINTVPAAAIAIPRLNPTVPVTTYADTEEDVTTVLGIMSGQLTNISNSVTAAATGLGGYALPAVTVSDKVESLISELQRRASAGRLMGSSAAKDLQVVGVADSIQNAFGTAAAGQPMLLSCQDLEAGGTVDLRALGHAVTDLNMIVKGLTQGMGLEGYSAAVGNAPAAGHSTAELVTVIQNAYVRAYASSLVNVGGTFAFAPFSAPFTLNVTGMGNGPRKEIFLTNRMIDPIKVGNFYRSCFAGTAALQELANIRADFASVDALVAECKQRLQDQLAAPAAGPLDPDDVAEQLIAKDPGSLGFAAFNIPNFTVPAIGINPMPALATLKDVGNFLRQCVEGTAILGRLGIRAGADKAQYTSIQALLDEAATAINNQFVALNAARPDLSDAIASHNEMVTAFVRVFPTIADVARRKERFRRAQLANRAAAQLNAAQPGAAVAAQTISFNNAGVPVVVEADVDGTTVATAA